MASCDPETLVEQRIDRVLTQYRESPKLLHMARTYLRKVAEVVSVACSLPEYFDLDTAIGDQLTLIGQRLGWPRCHCVCNTQPLFGFNCFETPDDQIVAGFCDETITWEDCGPFGASDLCINDDELYRNFLKVRRYQMLALYDLQSLTDAIRIFWGENATVLDANGGRVVIAPGRPLTVVESALLQLYPRVLPIAPGMRLRFHFGDTHVFGFGEGWGSFCEAWEPNGVTLVTHEGAPIVTEGGVALITGPLLRDSPWMCEVDPKPYDCAL